MNLPKIDTQFKTKSIFEQNMEVEIRLLFWIKDWALKRKISLSNIFKFGKNILKRKSCFLNPCYEKVCSIYGENPFMYAWIFSKLFVFFVKLKKTKKYLQKEKVRKKNI